MKISRNSWHYKMLESWSFEIPHNLCPYFWKVIFTLLLYPLITSVVIYGSFIATVPFWWSFTFNDIGGVVAASIVGTIEIVALLIVLKSSVQSRHRQEVYAGVREMPRDGLLKMWFKARYEKVCPYLEFE